MVESQETGFRLGEKPQDVPDNIDVISPSGDVLLDVLFETSAETLRAAKKSRPTRLSTQASTRPIPLAARVRVGFRVRLEILKKQSKYFDRLLGDQRFNEAKVIEAGLEQLSLHHMTPAEVLPQELPRICIVDDDEATKSAGRETVFGDLLRILHGVPVETSSVGMPYLAILAVLADRFDCTAAVSKSLNARLKPKWPVRAARAGHGDDVLLTWAAEDTLRQKVLVAWLLDQPLKMHRSTRDLIMLGSSRWRVVLQGDEGPTASSSAAWWDLPDDLERELWHRRTCILNAIASVQRHFLRLYTSRTRQCKMGYETSASCDSYQLGEMVRFLISRNLSCMVDFVVQSSLDGIPDNGVLDINEVLSTLKQIPNYQIDKFHINCGPRSRMIPILDYIKTMLSSDVISISRPAWKKERESVSWAEQAGRQEEIGADEFRFTRAIAGDSRLRYEGAMAANGMARDLFTSRSWNWTPED